MPKKTFDELREDARNARREIILDATAKLFKKKSIFKISMRDIALEAGMSAGNIYFYFEDRESIVRELMLKDEKNIIDIFSSIVKIDNKDAKALQKKLILDMEQHDESYAHAVV
jgi:AcrR family transcriptional regulator